jgi:hypothetical protein
MARHRTTPPQTRRLRLERALASDDPLGEVGALIREDTSAGQTFKWAFACVLETHSAELPILFDRYVDDDLRHIEEALEAIQATATLEDYRILKRAFDAAVSSGLDRLDASDAVANAPELAPVARRYKAHVAEMERQLVGFCRARVGEL